MGRCGQRVEFFEVKLEVGVLVGAIWLVVFMRS